MSFVNSGCVIFGIEDRGIQVSQYVDSSSGSSWSGRGAAILCHNSSLDIHRQEIKITPTITMYMLYVHINLIGFLLINLNT